MKHYLLKLLNLLVAASIPVLICAGVIRLLLTPIFTNIEYRMAHFPEDPYGFSLQERLEYGNLTRRYLVTNTEIDQLQELRFDSGESLYQERELSHLVDVKRVLAGLFSLAWVAGGVFLTASYVYYQRKEWFKFQEIISFGGWLTAGLIIAILLVSLLSFNAFFTSFHRVFFEGDSWLFRYSDTLIRLFPIQFWQDVFLVFGILTIGMGVLLGWLLPKKAGN